MCGLPRPRRIGSQCRTRDWSTPKSATGTYGTLTVTKADGAYSYVPNSSTINALSAAASETATSIKLQRREGFTGELALTLRRRGLAQVSVTSTQVDVRGVEQTEHPVADGLLSRRHARSDEARWSRPGANPSAGPGLARARRPLALARHPESRGSF